MSIRPSISLAYEMPQTFNLFWNYPNFELNESAFSVSLEKAERTKWPRVQGECVKLLRMVYLPDLQSLKENENNYCDLIHLNFKKSKKVA